MANPFFTVVIPTYNRGDRVGKTIASVIEQAYTDFEIIVVDDGSTDQTAEVVKGIVDPRITYVHTENRERAAARNAGTRLAKGNYVTFLDSDDRFYPDHLQKVHEALRGDPTAVYHQAYDIVDDSGNVRASFRHDGPELNELLFTRGNIMSCTGVFLRRDVAGENLFDETRILSGVEDWELWIRLAVKHPILHGNLPTAALVEHQGRSVNQANVEQWIERMDLFLRLVEGNKSVREKYGSMLARLRANASTYLSLHLSEAGAGKGKAVGFLVRGIVQSPGVLFQRRTGAIVRNLLFR